MYEPIVVKRILPAELDVWTKELSLFNYSLFLLPQWIEALSDNDCSPLYLDFELKGDIIAKLSGLVCNGGMLKGRQLYFYAAPAFRNGTIEHYQKCHLALKNWAEAQGYSRIVIGSYDQQTETVCNVKGYFPNYRYEYVVNFKSNDELGKYSTGFKKNVKKAEKLGTTFNVDNSKEMLDKMLDLMGITREHRTAKYGNGYNPFYLKNLNGESLQRLIDNGFGKMYHTSIDGEVNSVQFNIENEGKVYGLLMGSDGFAYKNGLPSFVDFNLIKKYNDEGFTYYNPGGGPSDEGGSGIEQYKKSMGAVKFIFAGCTTNFLVYPQRFLNPLLALGRRLPASDKGVVGLLKKLI